jgi:hypothetical protein
MLLLLLLGAYPKTSGNRQNRYAKTRFSDT